MKTWMKRRHEGTAGFCILNSNTRLIYFGLHLTPCCVHTVKLWELLFFPCIILTIRLFLRETLLLPGENWEISPVYTILSYNTIMPIKILLMLQNQMFLPAFKNCGGHIVDALRSLMLGLHFLFLKCKSDIRSSIPWTSWKSKLLSPLPQQFKCSLI